MHFAAVQKNASSAAAAVRRRVHHERTAPVAGIFKMPETGRSFAVVVSI